MTIPSNSQATSTTDPAWRRTNQHLSRRRNWTFMFHRGSWYLGTKFTSSLIAVWINDLVRDLNLSQLQEEFLASHLRWWNLSQQGVKVPYRKFQQPFPSFFKKEELVYCNDVTWLPQELGYTHNPQEWSIFVDFSKFILKAGLLRIGNIHPSIPTAHFIHMKETYENMDLLLKATSYSNYGWKICEDLKIIRLFLGMHSGQKKFCCFLCEWGGGAKQKTNITKLKIFPCEKS